MKRERVTMFVIEEVFNDKEKLRSERDRGERDAGVVIEEIVPRAKITGHTLACDKVELTSVTIR